MKHSLLVVALLTLAFFASPAVAQVSESYTEVSATAVNTSTTFGFVARYVRITNDGANEVFVLLSSTGAATATTAGMELKSGETQGYANVAIKSVGLICSAAETATVRLYAVR